MVLRGVFRENDGFVREKESGIRRRTDFDMIKV